MGSFIKSYAMPSLETLKWLVSIKSSAFCHRSVNTNSMSKTSDNSASETRVKICNVKEELCILIVIKH